MTPSTATSKTTNTAATSTLRYTLTTLKHLLKYPYIWVAQVALSLALGGMYGLLYRSFFASGAEIVEPTTSVSGNGILESLGGAEILEILPLLKTLGSIPTMQLSLFTGLTFFLSAFAVGQFIHHRDKRCHYRLIAMGYTNGQVFWGEGLAYWILNCGMTVLFHLAFIALNPEVSGLISAFQETAGTLGIAGIIGALAAITLLQSALAAGYSLMFLGLSRSQKFFTQFYFLPAFLMAFLGGAMFPMSRLSASGLYEWMPSYILGQHYSALYTGRFTIGVETLSQGMVLLALATALTLIGRWQFRLQDR